MQFPALQACASFGLCPSRRALCLRVETIPKKPTNINPLNKPNTRTTGERDENHLRAGRRLGSSACSSITCPRSSCMASPISTPSGEAQADHAGDDIPAFYPLQLPPWTVSSKHGSAGLQLRLRGQRHSGASGLRQGMELCRRQDHQLLHGAPVFGVAKQTRGSGMAALHRGQLPVSRPLSSLEQGNAALTIDLRRVWALSPKNLSKT